MTGDRANGGRTKVPRRLNVRSMLSEQGRKPAGALGWLTAHVMPAVFGSLYQKVAKLLDIQADDDVLDVACGSAPGKSTNGGCRSGQKTRYDS